MYNGNFCVSDRVYDRMRQADETIFQIKMFPGDVRVTRYIPASDSVFYENEYVTSDRLIEAQILAEQMFNRLYNETPEG